VDVWEGTFRDFSGRDGRWEDGFFLVGVLGSFLEVMG